MKQFLTFWGFLLFAWQLSLPLHAQTYSGIYSFDGCYGYLSTTIPGAITANASAQTVTPTTMNPGTGGSYPIQVNVLLDVSHGNADEEIVPVLNPNLSGGTFQAVFTKNHAGGVTIGGFCRFDFWAAHQNSSTAPTLIYVSGGGDAHMNGGCTPTFNPRGNVAPSGGSPAISACYFIWALNQMGWNVYEPWYTVFTDTGYTTNVNNQGPRNLKCFLARWSFGDAGIYMGGNTSQVVLYGESAGGGHVLSVGMTPPTKWYNDGNGACEDSATPSYTIRAIISGSANAPDWTNSPNGFFTTAPAYGLTLQWNNMFGGSNSYTGTPAALANDLSATNHIGDWQALPYVPTIINLVSASGTDGSPATQQTIGVAVAAAGGGPIYQVVAPGTNLGTGSQSSGSNYPPVVTPQSTYIANQTGSGTNCPATPVCETQSWVWRLISNFLNNGVPFDGNPAKAGGSLGVAF